MRKISWLLFLSWLLATPLLPAGSLYQQRLGELLAHRFPDSQVSYLLMDARSGEIVAARWPDPARALPMGSLVKPFTALAYGESHGFRYPEFVCRGEAGGCWYARGHGRIGMIRAVAYSCNAYFRQLAASVPPADVQEVLHRMGFPGPRTDAPSSALVGLGEDFKWEPVALLRAYLELAGRRDDPGIDELVRGLALSARRGTARGVGQALGGAPALAKTGTAPCIHQVAWSGDGYVLALYPPETPRWGLLVQVHGVPGAEAAIVGGRILQTVLEVR